MEVLKALFLILAAGVYARAELFPMHRVHAAKLGRLECNLCHQAAAKGSVNLKRPGHDQCKVCHAPAFAAAKKTELCAVCHQGNKLRAFPPLPERVLSDFSHRAHTDPKARVDAKTGFRADCLYCHGVSSGAMEPQRPGHRECASCHSKESMPAQLTPFLRAAGCRGCHNPEETEGPASRPAHATRHFAHARHFEAKRDSRLDCTSCHSAVPASTTLARVDAPAANQCASCHAVMEPESHTARWRDDLHGKYAAIDRIQCATCHATDYCSRCHNQLPRSHVPLPLFKNGGHANLAALNERSCFTCHTFQNSCASCHTRGLR